jgi:hypothetical protein
MCEAARDIDHGGIVAELFAGVAVPPGSVPSLRLLGALHHFVLGGGAPALGVFYPSVGGEAPPDGAWPVAERTIRENFDALKARLGRTVQTNEPGRSAVLFSALLWVTDRYQLPIRLLELGASAGLNLVPDEYRYVIAGHVLGNATSPVRFHEPCVSLPELDLVATARALRIVKRAGCDLAPLDPASPEDRLTLLSYVWADELERFNRAKTALALAAARPGDVAAESASDWLPRALAQARRTELTVVWHSLFRQYVEPETWDALQANFRDAVEADSSRSIVWLSMEPSSEYLASVELLVCTHPDDPPTRLAWCGDHGPPVKWERARSAIPTSAHR